LSTGISYYPNIVTREFNSLITGSIIINTPIVRDSQSIFKIDINGHDLNNNNLLNFSVAGIANSSAFGNIDSQTGAVSYYNISDNSNFDIPKWVGVNSSGRVAIAFGSTGNTSYFSRFTVNALVGNNTNTELFTGWDITKETGVNFGWKDLNRLTGFQQHFHGANQIVSGILSSNLISGAYPNITQVGNLTGITISGQNVVTGLVVRPNQTGNLLDTGMTGKYTGEFYPRSSNPSGFVTGSVIRPNDTGNFIDNGASGRLTGSFYPYYSNPSGYITGLSTGNFVTTSQTGVYQDSGRNKFSTLATSFNYFNSTAATGNNWYRIAQTLPGNYRCDGFVNASTIGGGVTPCFMELYVSHDWTSTSAITLLHRTPGSNFITDVRWVRNTGTAQSFLDIYCPSNISIGDLAINVYNSDAQANYLRAMWQPTVSGVTGGLNTNEILETTLNTNSTQVMGFSSNNANFGSGFFAVNTAEGVRCNKFTSTVSVGTAPLTVTSNTLVSNLNADLLDGLDSTAFVLTGNTGSFITTGQTGNFINNGMTGKYTGEFYPRSSNPSGFVTGSVIRSSDTGNFVDVGASGRLTGSFYPYYSNPSGYITGLSTGNFVTSNQTGNFLTSALVVFITGDQTISGLKTFVSGISTTNIENPGSLARIDLNANIIYDGDENISIDWLNRTLSGAAGVNWKTNALSISGQSVVISSQTGNFINNGMTGRFLTTGSTGAYIVMSSGLISGFSISGVDARFNNLWVNNVKITGNGGVGGNGTITSGVSVGTGSSIFSGVSGSSLAFKTLKAGNGAVISDNNLELSIGVNLTNNTNNGTDVIVLSTGPYLDVLQTNLTSGTWIVNGNIAFATPDAFGHLNIKLWDGISTAWAASEGSFYSNGGGGSGFLTLPISSIISTTGTTVYLSATNSVGNPQVIFTPSFSSSGLENKLSQLTTFKIG
jgi:hypothetical protein